MFRTFIVLLVSLAFVQVTPVVAREPLPLVFDHVVEISDDEGSTRFCVHMADDEQSRRIGLMFRESLPERHGMIFDFGLAGPVSMWMQNTPLSLDMIFITDDFRVLRIERDTVPFSTRIIASGGEARYVLEVTAGEALTHGISSGDRVAINEGNCAS